jgi:hypothetical protein
MSSKPNIGYQQTEPPTKDNYNAATFFFFFYFNLCNLEILIFFYPFKKRIYNRIFFVGIAKLQKFNILKLYGRNKGVG